MSALGFKELAFVVYSRLGHTKAQTNWVLIALDESRVSEALNLRYRITGDCNRRGQRKDIERLVKEYLSRSIRHLTEAENTLSVQTQG